MGVINQLVTGGPHIACMTEIKHPTLQMGQFKQLGSFTEVSFLETCEAHAGWKQTWHSRDPGFFDRWIISFRYGFGPNFHGRCLFSPSCWVKPANFQGLPPNVLLTKESLLWFLCQRGHIHYFLHIFYIFSTFDLGFFLHFFPNALLCCCAFQEPTSWTTGMCSTATVVWFKWLWMVVNGS